MDEALEAKRAFIQSLQDFVNEAAPSLSVAKRSLLAKALFQMADRWADLPETEASAFLDNAKLDILRRFGMSPSRVYVRIKCHPVQPGATDDIEANAMIYFSRLCSRAGVALSRRLNVKPPEIQSGILSVAEKGPGLVVHSFLEGRHLDQRAVRQAIARASRKGKLAISEVVPSVKSGLVM